MQFEILAFFSDAKQDYNQTFLTTFKSIVGQKSKNWKLIVIGTSEQISITDQIITGYSDIKNLTNSIDLIKTKNGKKTDLNLAFSFLGKNLDPNKPNTKLVIVKIGDYLSTDFLSEAEQYLKSLELTDEYLEPKLAYADFKYVNTKQNVYNSNFILKTNFTNLETKNFIFEPKLLLHPIQFFWDLDLIKKNHLKLESDLPSFELQLAKFNLDYILALTELNGFLLPQAKFNSKSYYIASNELIASNIADNGKIWKEILKTKHDVFEKIGGKIWWTYRLMNLF